MSIAEKITQIVENEKKVYDAGKKAEYDAFWERFTDYGERTSYYRGFMNMNFEYIRPNRKIIPKSADSGSSTFNAVKSLKKVEAAYFDFSQKMRGTTATNGFYYTFYNCPALEEIEDIGMQADYGYQTTFSCPKLHTIAKIRTDENTRFQNAFDYSYNLKNISFEGVIAQNGVNLRWSTNLSKSSIISLINVLSTTTSGLSVTLSKIAVNNAFGINVDDQTTYPEGSEYYTLRHSKDNWTVNYI